MEIIFGVLQDGTNAMGYEKGMSLSPLLFLSLPGLEKI